MVAHTSSLYKEVGLIFFDHLMSLLGHIIHHDILDLHVFVWSWNYLTSLTIIFLQGKNGLPSLTIIFDTINEQEGFYMICIASKMGFSCTKIML